MAESSQVSVIQIIPGISSVVIVHSPTKYPETMAFGRERMVNGQELTGHGPTTRTGLLSCACRGCMASVSTKFDPKHSSFYGLQIHRGSHHDAGDRCWVAASVDHSYHMSNWIKTSEKCRKKTFSKPLFT